jgi:hypothetical protein
MGWTTKVMRFLPNVEFRDLDINIKAALTPYNCMKTYVNSRIFQRMCWKDMICKNE